MGWYHFLGCGILILLVFPALRNVCTVLVLNENASEAALETPWQKYGWFAVILYLSRYLALLALPQAVCNFLGLLLYDSFPPAPELKQPLSESPPICFRVVTRGDYGELVYSNVQRNVSKCLDTGLDNFIVEVVTDKSMTLPKSRWVRELVVPSSYKTKSGAMFKARALQYALESETFTYLDNSWIVHLDEETILTESCLRGIVNFVCDGKHKFGQGLITYANEEIVSYFLTLCDTVRVADDMGKLQFGLRALKWPVFGWKGSFVVTKLDAEKQVSYDNGPDSSVCEDAYFGLLAASQGFTFAFIEGEMWEKSPFTLIDFLRQRKRWLQGLLLVSHSSGIPLRYRLLLAIGVYSWVTVPLTGANLFLQPLFPMDVHWVVDTCLYFIGGVFTYMYIYGVCRSFKPGRLGYVRFLALLLTGVLVTPFKLVVEIAAVVWGLVTPKHSFFVVDKRIVAKIADHVDIV